MFPKDEVEADQTNLLYPVGPSQKPSRGLHPGRLYSARDQTPELSPHAGPWSGTVSPAGRSSHRLSPQTQPSDWIHGREGTELRTELRR